MEELMRLIRMSLLAAVLAVTPLSAAIMAPQVAQAQTTPSPATVAKGMQIVANLHLYDLLVYGGRVGILKADEIAKLPQADQDRIAAMFVEEMTARRDDTIRKMAEANFGSFTPAQLDDLLALSKIKYVQDLVLAGGDSSLATPDETSMNATERALFTRLMNETWVTDFFTKFNYDTASANVAEAAQAAMQRYLGQ